MSKPHRRQEAASAQPRKRRTAARYLHGLLAPLMLALFVAGGFFVFVCIGTNGAQPVEALGYGNILVGAGCILAGFGVVAVDVVVSDGR